MRTGKRIPPQDEHGGGVDALARTLGVTRCQILDLSTNTFSMCSGITENVLAATPVNGADVFAYPDPWARRFCEAAATHEGVATEQVLAGNGAAELIWLCLGAVKPKRVLMLGPMFSEYARACEAMDISYSVLAPEGSGFLPDRQMLDVLCHHPADMVIACLPNNPGTSDYGPCFEELVAALGGAGKHGENTRRTVLLDLSYREFLYGSVMYERTRRSSLEAMFRHGLRLVCLHSMTKFFCCPGIRLGYAVTDESTVALLRSHQPPWMVAAYASGAGVRFLERIREYRAMLPGLRGRIEALAAQLALSGLFRPEHVLKGPSFVTARLIEEHRTKEVRDFLADGGILVRACDTIPGMPPGYLRIQARSAERLHSLFDRLALFKRGR